MTIEPREIEDGINIRWDFYHWQRRLLLRPHGRSEGRVIHTQWISSFESTWWVNGVSYFTRAQAAAVVYKEYADNLMSEHTKEFARAAWEAHKEAEKEIRAMMPSVTHSWTEDAE